MNNITSKVDCFFSITSIILLIHVLFHSDNTISFICAIIVSLWLPGYVLLRLLGFTYHSTWFEWPVLAFAISVGVTPLLVNLSQLFSTDRPFLISLIYAGVSLTPMVKNLISNCNEKVRSSEDRRFIKCNLFDVIILLWIALFFIFIISSFYPQMANIVGLDITAHFSSSRLLLLAPEVYHSSYPWYHSLLATVYELSNPIMEVFQTGLAYLGLVSVFAFYIMAKAYLTDVDKRAPVLAAVFFFVFSGFGWLDFLGRKLIPLGLSNQVKMLDASNSVSLGDIGHGPGPWVWLWFRPMTIAFMIVCLLIYLINRKDLSKRLFIPIFSILMVTLSFVHLPEVLMFSTFLLVLTLFIPKTVGLRLKDASLSILIANIIILLILPTIFGGMVEYPSIYVLLILLCTPIISVIIIYRPPKRLMFNLSSDKITRFVRVLAGIVVLGFLVSILSWLSLPNLFSDVNLNEILLTPTLLYPMLLGVVGLFAVISIPILTRNYGKKPIIIFILLFLFTFGFGKILSFVNAQFMDIRYWEQRLLPFVFAAASIIASISFGGLMQRLFNHKKKFLVAPILALIVISGVMSTNLTIESWKFQTQNPDDLIDYYSLDATEYLSSPNNRDINSPILTISPYTRNRAMYIPTPYSILNYMYPIWESQRPEIPLLLLYNMYYSPPYLFLDRQDLDYFASSNYTNGFLATHMIHSLSQVYRNPEISVLRFPNGVPPLLDSKVVLITPDENSTDYFYAYDILSLGGNDYTVSLSSDIKTIQSAETIIMARDDEDYAKLLENLILYTKNNQGNKRVVILNLNGNGPLSELFFKIENKGEDIEANYINGSVYNLDLPTEVDVAPLIMREGVRILAWYSNGENVTPFSVELEMDTIKLVYINLYPLIESYILFKTDSNITHETNLILNLPMGELEDGRVRDISMNGNDGLVYDTKQIPVPTFGITLDFDGNKSFVEVMNSETINPSDEITIETWIKPRTPDEGFIIASKKMGYSSLNGYFFLYENGNFHFNFGNGTSVFPNSVSSASTLKAEQWYHLAVTYDRHYVKFFLNGINIGSIRRSEIIAPNDLNLLIGKRQDQVWKLNGSIYEIVMYNKALTESEIKTHAQKFARELLTLELDPTYPILGRILGRITQVAGIDLEATTNYNPWVFEGNTAFFREASLNGSVVIKTPSFTDLKIDELVNATVIIDNQIVPMTPLIDLSLNGVDDIEIYTQEADLQQGKGFYVKTILTDSTISVFGKNVSVKLITSDG
ncbi:MAG: LamG domain-containing protein, partial [Promethearchaeota archaeon]